MSLSDELTGPRTRPVVPGDTVEYWKRKALLLDSQLATLKAENERLTKRVEQLQAYTDICAASEFAQAHEREWRADERKKTVERIAEYFHNAGSFATRDIIRREFLK